MFNIEEMRSAARDRLQEYGIRPSAQRVAIMQYLLNNFTHPTIEEIYTTLAPVIPTLSKTTVYNTLRMFSDLGAAQMITIDDHHVCYDGQLKPHAHFICRECGCVKDLWHMDIIPPQHPNSMQEGCFVNEMQIYCKGLCGKCLAKHKSE